MTYPAIQADQLTKRYRLGAGAAVEQTLAERVTSGLRLALGRGGAAGSAKTFHALDGVSFDVRPGEVLGVTESRVSQLHTKAVMRLKSQLQQA